MEYKQLYKSESHGGYGAFGIEILVAGSKLPDLSLKEIQYAVYDAVGKIEAEIRSAAIAVDPEAQERAIAERNAILGLFPAPIFAEPIPNGYCSSWCCRHLPWFIVTTTIGRFKIGWRKRVLHIEWSETIGTKTAEALFPGEEVTKGERYIHAWSMDKAKEYISAVINSTKLETSTTS